MQILTEPRNALTRQYQHLFAMENVDLVFEPDALRAVAKKALTRNTGARGLRSILENVLLETMYDLPSSDETGTVRVTEAVITQGKQPELLPTRLLHDDGQKALSSAEHLHVINTKSA